MEELLAMPLVERKAAGIHHAYSLAGVPFPWRTEQAHTMMIGSTGTGKTTQMRALIAQMRKRRDRAVVFDLTGAYVEAFYNPETDTILNPMDERCPSWSVFAEAKNHADFTGIAAALLPADGGGAEPFWMLAARTLFVETCMRLIKLGKATNQFPRELYFFKAPIESNKMIVIYDGGRDVEVPRHPPATWHQGR